jgi:hypothetical protein
MQAELRIDTVDSMLEAAGLLYKVYWAQSPDACASCCDRSHSSQHSNGNNNKHTLRRSRDSVQGTRVTRGL